MISGDVTPLRVACDTTVSPDTSLFEQIALGIEQQGFVILPAAIGTLCDSLLEQLATVEDRKFLPARVGRGLQQTLNNFVRRDTIYWIDSTSPTNRSWLEWTQALQGYLNSRLFLGLFSFESHYARYDCGDFYRRHVDAFAGKSNRVLSLVTYLNRGWEPGQGGELVMYESSGAAELVRVTPAYGTLVLFLSTGFPHEVLPCTRQRYSVAGWFRLNGSVNDDIDPPS